MRVASFCCIILLAGREGGRLVEVDSNISLACPPIKPPVKLAVDSLMISPDKEFIFFCALTNSERISLVIVAAALELKSELIALLSPDANSFAAFPGTTEETASTAIFPIGLLSPTIPPIVSISPLTFTSANASAAITPLVTIFAPVDIPGTANAPVTKEAPTLV